MEVLLDCSICRNPFDYEQRQPHILACGHTFCRACLIHMRSSLQSIRCPIDRRIEIREMHKLPVNYALLQVIDHHKTGTTTKEKCNIHKSPVSMICRTCHMNCCPKCIRKHSNHDMFDIENPVILKDIENRLDKYETKLRTQYEECGICNNRISFEIDQLKDQQGSIRKEINLYYDTILQNLDMKRQQSFNTLDYYYKDKMDTLNQQASETNERFKYYEQHLNNLLNCKKEL